MNSMDSPIEQSCPPDTLCLTPLGGLGEIGLNMMTVEYGGAMLLIDAGLMFPEEYMLGIDVVIPDITYLRENRERLLAVLLTHGHEDHIGALPFVLGEIQAPVFGTRFTLELLRQKLSEVQDLEPVDLREVKAGDVLQLGPFSVEFIRVCHSVVDCSGLAISTPLGTIIHSGDFKIDPAQPEAMRTDVKRFAWYGKQGVLALLSDSTNVEREGHTLSERDVKKTLGEIFANCTGRVIMAVFASHIQRIQQAVDLSVRYGRKVIFNGKSVKITAQIARELGYLKLAPSVEIDINDMRLYPDSEITLITTGSQAEPLSAITRMAHSQHKKIAVREPDTVIFSSSFIPGNERAITRVINMLYRQGAEVIYETVSDIHASGHAYREELKTMIRLTRPRYFIPVHGEYRHLVRHGRLAREEGLDEDRILVAENGVRFFFDREGARLGGAVPVGRILVDGKGVGDVDRPVLRDRRRLSEHGVITALVVVDETTGELLAPLEVISKGLIPERQNERFMEIARDIVMETLGNLEAGSPVDWAEVEKQISTNLKRFLYKNLERRPVILPVIVPI